jgi:hypothetical protein
MDNFFFFGQEGGFTAGHFGIVLEWRITFYV